MKRPRDKLPELPMHTLRIANGRVIDPAQGIDQVTDSGSAASALSASARSRNCTPTACSTPAARSSAPA